jgi:hypothetical protein
LARRWFAAAQKDAAEGGRLSVMPMVLASFLRLVTHPRVFSTPTPLPEAVAFIDALLASPGVVLVGLSAEWRELRELCLKKGLKANDLPDAWLAAAVRHTGETLATFDRDFRRLLGRGEVIILEP